MPLTPTPSFYLTEEQAAEVGLTEAGARDLVNRLCAHVGYVLGATGRGGSGVWVENPQGHTGLLTARHVAIGAILTGELTLLESDGQVGRSKRAGEIWIHPTSDLAVIAAFATPPRLSLAEWSVDAGRSPVAGEVVIAIGAPGAWKSDPNLSARSIARMGTLCFWATVLAASGAIVIDVAPKPGVPESMRGMSGGPVFDLTGTLLGVLECESIAAGARTIRAIPRVEFAQFVVPFKPDPEAPGGHRAQFFDVLVSASHPTYGVPAITVLAFAEHFVSDEGEHKHAAFGRIRSLTFHPPSRRATTVYTEHIYLFPMEHAEEDRQTELQAAVCTMLDAMGFTMLGVEVHESRSPKGAPGIGVA